MSGGYIACGSFAGGDKSGSAIEGLLDGLAHFLPPAEADQFLSAVLNPLQEAGYSEEQTMTISREMVPYLEGPLRGYYKHLGERLGHPLPDEAPGLDRGSGLHPVEAKWGGGLGWQYYCAHDLLRACEESRRTGGSIVLSFD